MKSAMSRAVAVGLAVLLAGSPFAPAPVNADQTSCRTVNVPVAVLGTQTMYGQLCEPATATQTVFVLVPGATYTGDYWNLPPQLGLYPFREHLNADGYATLVVDRLGSGNSSHPLSATLTSLIQADAVHQVIQRLHNGSLGSGYANVIIGGHSLGGAIAVLEAATYHDVAGVLMAGISHHLDPVDAAANFFLSLYPAALDPQLVLRGFDLGYLTTLPGSRARAFHNPAAAPAAIAHDESTKDVFAPGEAADAVGVAIIAPYTALITAPVLLAASDGDELMCGPLPPAADCSSPEPFHAQEAPYFSAQAQLETYLLPGHYGHSFNYAPNADQFQHVVTDWADRKVGR